MARKANIGASISLDGEKEYRQAISNVSKSMNVLKSDLKAVTAEFEGNANSIDALKAKNTILLNQQSEQEKKLQLLRGALIDANKQYGEGSKQAQDWQIKLNNAYSDLTKLNKELSDNEKYMKEAETSTDKTAKSIDEFGKQVKDTKQETLTFGDVLKANLSSQAIIEGVKALGRALKDVAGAAVNVVKESAEYADNILTMSTQTGIATDKLQELSYMSELTDTSLETVTASMARNIRSMNSASNGTKLYVDAYKQLGVQITDTNGQLKDSEQVFWQSIDALGGMANETERDAAAMQLFGKSAQDLNPLIEIGSSKVAEFAKEARDMGAVLSTDTLNSLGKTDDALQRFYQQIEVSKRTIGTGIAPQMTEAIETVTEKISEADDKFADFAGGAITDVTDGFIWLIDNLDLVAAGLKGVAAAFITKKAADGVNAAVTAYRTLTTVTEAATGATVALNTATKASVIGAIASIMVGVGTAVYSYAKSASDAAEETRKLNDESLKLLDNSQKISSNIQKDIDDRKKAEEAITSEYAATNRLADNLYALADKENKSNSEKGQMLALIEQLNKAIPDLNLSLNEQTGELNLQASETKNLIDAQLELQRVQAAGAKLATLELNKIDAEQALTDAVAAQTAKYEELQTAKEEYEKAANPRNHGSTVSDMLSAANTVKRLKEEYSDCGDAVENATTAVTNLGIETENTMKYLGDHSAIDGATTALGKFLDVYQDTLEQQNQEYADGLDERISSIEDTYDASEKALDKNQKAEKKALDKAQKEQIKAVEDASDEELKILEEKHKEKLKLIDDEYLQKMKLTDEDRYNELKAVQDQIDSIDNQSEAEDRARKLKEEADKRAELTAQVASATTTEDKLAAQQELADFEAETAADRLKTERELQKDILEEQKDTINDTYDAKIKALEEEQKKKEEAATTVYENEKLAIADRLETKKQEIADIQELEDTALSDKQTAEQEAVDKQKEYAIQSAKDTYEADLTEFKLNNALKYDAAVANQDAINKYILEHDASGTGPLGVLSGPNAWDPNRPYIPFNPGKQEVSYNLAFDYDKLGSVVTNGVKNLSVVLNGKVVGKIVEGTVNQMIK